MRFEADTEIAADAEQVWAVLVDVPRWPEWTASVSPGRAGGAGAARRRRDGPADPAEAAAGRVAGHRADRGREFIWASRRPGVRTRGEHRLLPLPDGRTRVELAINQSGPLAGLIGWLYGGLFRRYLRMEADGLRRRCERG